MQHVTFTFSLRKNLEGTYYMKVSNFYSQMSILKELSHNKQYINEVSEKIVCLSSDCKQRVKILHGCSLVVCCIALGSHALRPTLQFLDHINPNLSGLIKILSGQAK